MQYHPSQTLPVLRLSWNEIIKWDREIIKISVHIVGKRSVHTSNKSNTKPLTKLCKCKYIQLREYIVISCMQVPSLPHDPLVIVPSLTIKYSIQSMALTLSWIQVRTHKVLNVAETRCRGHRLRGHMRSDCYSGLFNLGVTMQHLYSATGRV